MFVLHMNLNALFPPFSPPRDSNSAEVTTRCRRTASKTCSKVRSTTWRSRCCPEWTASRRGSPGCATRRSSVGEWSPPSRLSTRGSPTWRKVAKWKEEITQGGRSRIFFFSLWRYQITVREGNGREKKPYSVRIQFGIVSLYDPDLMFYSSSQSWSSPPHRAVSCSNSCRLNHFEHALNDPSLRLLPEPSEKLKQEGKKKQKQTHGALWVCPPSERERERERKERKLQICVEEGTNTRLTTPLLLW